MEHRRKNVPFDPFYFEKLKKSRPDLSAEETFRIIHQQNHWEGTDSISGEGSGRKQTRELETAIPRLLDQLNVNILLDLPCGDFSWMQRINLPISRYIGADIVEELITANQKTYGNPNRQFIRLDLISDPLPPADMLLCRDCLVHLSFDDIFKAIDNIRHSRIPYLLTTTFIDCEENEDIETGDWRVINLEKPPFNFPPPVQLINEGCSEAEGRFSDKSLGLWLVDDL